MPAIYHEGLWLGNATDPEVLVKDTVGWTGKNRAYSQTNNAVIAHIENGITYDVSWTGSATVTLKKNSASGATITSGSTSPLSFTADADYELYFGSSATVTNIMVKDSRITDPTYEPYHESVEEEIEQIYANNGVLGAKNLLKYMATTQTINGVTFTVNEDKSITVNGTATADATFTLLADYAGLEKGVYKITGCPTGGTATTYEIFTAVRHLDATATEFVRDFGNGASLTVDNNTRNIALSIIVRNNTTVSNIVFKPMLRLASDPDDTYQPYAMTNRELTETINGKDVTVLVHSLQSSNVTLENTTFARLRGSLLAYKFRFTTTSEIAAAQNIAYIALDFYPAIRAQNIVGLNVTTGGVAVIDIAGYSNNKNLYFQSRTIIPANTTISISGVIDIA